MFQIINTQQNKSFLEKVSHREFQDLSIVYRVVINEDKNGIQSTKVTNELADRLGMSEEELFKCAAENTKRLSPTTVRSMNDVMKDMFLKDGKALGVNTFRFAGKEPASREKDICKRFEGQERQLRCVPHSAEYRGIFLHEGW